MFDFDTTPPKKARIEIIPMIDVMMFLLVFFVLISLNVIPALGIKTNLPKSSQTQSLSRIDSVTLTVVGSGRAQLDGVEFDFTALEGEFRRIKDKAPLTQILVRTEAQSTVQDLVKALDLLAKVGIEKVSLVTTPE
jgi:biopolymer transport protein ExbD